ncbi:hypothetical protein NX801_13580 [Streptomyces sp. LP05-1]|uniref:Uncharacterized protein n=1 Tax=Streptomyces pyxinae TaxID=2970734 RepID=A0ABT2CGY0_9ACTN|nr:hypothetical protein [Streptomyces sp. LP05-1]MCS0636670.1 hypothetical protein [Streptomyces sp. LP05-1]
MVELCLELSLTRVREEITRRQAEAAAAAVAAARPAARPEPAPGYRLERLRDAARTPVRIHRADRLNDFPPERHVPQPVCHRIELAQGFGGELPM